MAGEVCIFGVGGPHGDDQVGWLLVESLRGAAGLRAESFAVADPVDMVSRLAGCRRAIIVDGCVSGAAPGSLVRLEWSAAALAGRPGHSTHALSVREALQLAARLGRLPAEVVLLGIEIRQCQPGRGLSPEVARALPALRQKVLDEVN